MEILNKITQYLKGCYARTNFKRIGKQLAKGLSPVLGSLFGGIYAGPVGRVAGHIIGSEIGEILVGYNNNMQGKYIVA